MHHSLSIAVQLTLSIRKFPLHIWGANNLEWIFHLTGKLTYVAVCEFTPPFGLIFT